MIILDNKIKLFSDSHFYHRNIIEYCGRPKDHNELMWKNLEEGVEENDTLIHLGDVVWHGKPAFQRRVIDRLPGKKKILVQGNHDPKKVRNYTGWDHVVKTEEQPLVYLLGDGVKVYFSHRFLGVHPGSLVIHGHIHEKGVPVRWAGDCMIVNACVEQWDYHPIPLESLIQTFKAGT